MNVALLSFPLEPQLGYAHHQYGKQSLFLETSNIIKHREPPREEAICGRQGESKVRSHGQHQWLFLGFVGSRVVVLLLFFLTLCKTHSLEKAGFTQLAEGSLLFKLPNYKLRHINSSQPPRGGIIDH